MERRKNARLALCGLAAFGLTCVGTALPAAYAGTTTWTGAGSSNSWGNAGNWSGGAPPATGDDVFFSGSAAITQLIALLNTAYSLNSLTFNPGSSAKSFTITAGGANNVLSIGAGGIVNNTALTQTIDAPIALTASTTFNAATAGGTLSFLGTSSNANNAISMGGNNLTIAGPGNTTIAGPISSNSSALLTKNGTGTLTLTGNGNALGASVLFNNGTTLIQGANSASYASLSVAFIVYIGYNANDNGTVIVAGTDGNGHASTLNLANGSLYVGSLGSGTLNVTGGGSVLSNFGDLGSGAGTVGTATISGSDGSGRASTWNVGNGTLYIGAGGTGVLNITNGGKVVNTGGGGVSLSLASGSHSTLNINGGNLTTDTLIVGSGATPTISLTNPTAANGGGYALNLGNNNGSTTVGFAIGDAVGGAGGIDKIGTGTLTLNAANTFSGGMQIDGGSVVLGNANALQNSTATINVNNGLNLNSLSAVTLGGLAGTGNLALGNSSLTVGGNNASTTYSGVLSGTNASATFTKNGTGTLTLTGVGSSVAGPIYFNNGATLIQGATSTTYASLNVNNYVFLGFNAGNSGTVTVAGTNGSGTASSLSASGIYDGFNGNGTINVTSGGKVTADVVFVGTGSTSVGNLSINGTDASGIPSTVSTNNSGLIIGDGGNGTVNVTNGGKLVGFYDYIGRNSGGIGVINVSGMDSFGHSSTYTSLANGNLFLGGNSSTTGTLNISGGGAVSGSTTYLGGSSGSAGFANVSGIGANGTPSTWNINSAILYVGQSGTGTISVTGGGLLTSAGAYLGYDTSGTGVGTATVSGTDGSGNASTWNLGAHDLFVGRYGTGTLNITNGGKVVNTGGGGVSLSFASGSHSTLNINGGNLTTDTLIIGSGATPTISLTNPTAANGGGYALTLGNTNGSTNLGVAVANAAGGPGGINKIGTGTLTLSAANTFTGGLLVSGGTVAMTLANALSGDQSVTVTGSGSTLTDTGNTLLVGNTGTGSLLVSSGGSVTSASAFVGNGASANGTATVTGAGSTLTLNGSELDVAFSGTGALNVAGGGKVNSVTSVIGHAAGSNGTVTVSGTDSSGNASLFTNGSNNLYAGYYGTGTLSVTGGGIVNSGTGYIGLFSGSTGTVTVSGTSASGSASTWNVGGGGLLVGYQGAATLNITNGGKVTTGAMPTYLNASSGSSSVLNIDGGRLTSDTLSIGSGSVAISLTNPTVANGGGYALNLGGSNGSSSVGVAIADAAGGAGGIRKTGTGTLTLNAANTFSGGMQIDGGVVTLGNGNALQNSTAIINVNNGLNLNGLSSVTLGGLAGTGDFAIGNSSLTVGGNNASTTYSGVFSNTNTSATLTKTGTGTLTLTGAGNSFNGSPSNFTGSTYFNNGTVQVQGKDSSSYGSLSTSSVYTYIGANSGDNGTVNISGTSSSGTPSAWNYGGFLYVGYNGIGNMNITGGATVSSTSGGYSNWIGLNSGSTGIVTVSGTNSSGVRSTWNMPSGSGQLTVGANGTGYLYVTGGALVSAQAFTIPNGTVTISGTSANGLASTLTTVGTPLVGQGGTGTLNVTGGGVATTPGGYFGYNAGDTGSITVSGTSSSGAASTWNATLPFIGYYGTGNLTVSGGGTALSNGGCYLGTNAGSTATATVSGASDTGIASKWTVNGTLYVGYSGTGNLNIMGGGKVAAGATYVSSSSGSASSLSINGGSLTTNTVVVGSGATPTISLTNPTVANGGGYALNLGGSNGSSTIGVAIKDAAGGAGGIQKTGTGTLTLSGVSTYSGGTLIGAGKIVAGGTAVGTGKVTIASGATLSVGEALNNTLSPITTQSLSASSLAVTLGSATPLLTFDLGASGTSDVLNLTSTTATDLTFSGSGVFDIGFASATGKSLGAGTYTLITFASPEATASAPAIGSYQAFAQNNLARIGGGTFSYQTNGANNITALLFNITSADATPEPSALLLLALGLPGFGSALVIRRRVACSADDSRVDVTCRDESR